jgi:hypothetical protein
LTREDAEKEMEKKLAKNKLRYEGELKKEIEDAQKKLHNLQSPTCQK